MSKPISAQIEINCRWPLERGKIFRVVEKALAEAGYTVHSPPVCTTFLTVVLVTRSPRQQDRAEAVEWRVRELETALSSARETLLGFGQYEPGQRINKAAAIMEAALSATKEAP